MNETKIRYKVANYRLYAITEFSKTRKVCNVWYSIIHTKKEKKITNKKKEKKKEEKKKKKTRKRQTKL